MNRISIIPGSKKEVFRAAAVCTEEILISGSRPDKLTPFAWERKISKREVKECILDFDFLCDDPVFTAGVVFFNPDREEAAIVFRDTRNKSQRYLMLNDVAFDLVRMVERTRHRMFGPRLD